MTVPMSTPTLDGPGAPPRASRWTDGARRWPAWAPSAAVGWAVVFASVQLVWAATGVTVPWSPRVDYAPPAQLLLALLALLAGAACWATTLELRRRGRAGVAAVLALCVPVFATGMLSLPAHFVTLVSFSGVESATGLAHVLLDTVGVVLLLLTGVSYRRRLRGRCARCGQEHQGDHYGPLRHPGASTASRRTRTTVYLLMCGLLPWAGAKTVWTLGGDALGVTAEAWREENEGGSAVTEALARVGVDVTVLAAGAGIFLLLGLMYPWGQVFPRWTLFLSGRRVPRMLPLVPAWLTAVGLSVYGVALLVYTPLAAVGVFDKPEPEGAFTTASGLLWMIAFGGMAFGGLGFGLIAAARSYTARTRPVCAAALAADGTGPAEGPRR